MPSVFTREMAELAKRIQTGIQSGNKKEVLEAADALEIEFAAAIDRAPSTERMAILGTCYFAYQSIREWELAALKIEDSICYAEKHHRNSPETAADYAHLAQAYLFTGDAAAAVAALEIAIAQMKETPDWPNYRALYEKNLEEMTRERQRSAQGPARKNPRLLRCPLSVVAEEQIMMEGGKYAPAREADPDRFPQFDPIYVVLWELQRLPTAEETSAIVYGFVQSGEIPMPDAKTRLLRMTYTGDWENANSLDFNIAVHKLLKRTFPELAPYLLVSDTGFEHDARLKMAVVSGIGCIGNPPSKPLRFRVVEVRPGAAPPAAESPLKNGRRLLAAYVLRQRTSPSEGQAADLVRRCIREHYGESTLRACAGSPALVSTDKGGRLFSTYLRKPGDVRELMPGFIRTSGNDPLLDYPANYQVAYSVIESGEPPEPTCVALCFGPDPADFDPHLVDAAGFAQSRGDDAEAARLLRLGAGQGIARAQYNLGILLYEGRGVRRNHQEATAWFQKAADQDYANAVYMLAFMLENGHGCTKDLHRAWELYRRGAELNEEDSQLKVACLLLSARLQAKAGVAYRKEGWDFISANDDGAVERLRDLSRAGDPRATRMLKLLEQALRS